MLTSWRRLLTSLLFFGALLASHASAQFSTGSYSISGTVTDPSGAGIPGADVQVRLRGATAATGTARTDALGSFRVSNVPDGSFEIEAQHEGFAAQTVRINIK